MDFRLHLADQPVVAVALTLMLMLDLSTSSTQMKERSRKRGVLDKWIGGRPRTYPRRNFFLVNFFFQKLVCLSGHCMLNAGDGWLRQGHLKVACGGNPSLSP